VSALSIKNAENALLLKKRFALNRPVLQPSSRVFDCASKTSRPLHVLTSGACSEAFGASKSGQENDALSAGSVRGSRSWQVLAQRVFQNDDRPIILYDGICNLCNGTFMNLSTRTR